MSEGTDVLWQRPTIQTSLHLFSVATHPSTEYVYLSMHIHAKNFKASQYIRKLVKIIPSRQRIIMINIFVGSILCSSSLPAFYVTTVISAKPCTACIKTKVW